MSALRIRESNPRTWRPFNPASIIGMSRIRGCLQERAPSWNPPDRQPPSPWGVAETGRRRRRGRGFPCFLAATHYFLVVAFDVDGPGHSKRLIENFLRLENGARNAIGGCIAGTLPGALSPTSRRGVEKEESIYLTCRTVWSPWTIVRGRSWLLRDLHRIIPSSGESRRAKSRKKDTLTWRTRVMPGKK